MVPPNGNDGHGLFTHERAAWRPTVVRFLRANGYPDLPAEDEERK
jgi:hypothetical protein